MTRPDPACVTPPMARIRVIHNDFCPETLVVDPNGRPHAVDKEAMALWFLDTHMARTRYRWGMDVIVWRRFLSRCAAHRVGLPSPECFRFWCPAATARSARIRGNNDLEGAEAALIALGGLPKPEVALPSPANVACRKHARL